MPNLDKCQLHLPFKALDGSDPLFATKLNANMKEIERWAERFYRGGCVGGDSAPVAVYKAFAFDTVNAAGNWAIQGTDLTETENTNFSVTNDDIKPGIAGWYLIVMRVEIDDGANAGEIRVTSAMDNVEGEVFNDFTSYPGGNVKQSSTAIGVALFDGSTHTFNNSVDNPTADSITAAVEIDAILVIPT